MTAKKQNILLFMCWLAYVAAYTGRYSYTANVAPISDFFGVSDTEVSLATTFFFFVYGAGQIVNGLLCRRYNMKYMLCGALVISSVVNLSVFLGVEFRFIKWLWLINGAVQSTIWPSLLRILSKNLDAKRLDRSVVVMSTTVGMGTFIAYGASALFSLWDGFKYSFLLGAVITFTVGIVWFFMHDKITDYSQGKEEKTVKAGEKKKNAFGVILYTLAVFGGFAIVINLIKDGLTTWVPKILIANFSLSTSLSILLTLLLPLAAVAGTFVVMWLYKYVHDYLSLLNIMFLSAIVCFAGVLAFINDSWIAVIVLFALLSMIMSATNNIVTSMVPLYMRDKANSGFIGGIINGCCYVGSTLSQFLLVMIAEGFGSWTPVLDLMLVLCIVASLVSLVFVYNFTRKGKSLG